MNNNTEPLEQLQLFIEHQHITAAEDMLLAAGALSVTIDTDSTEELFQLEPNQQPLWQHARLTALYHPKQFNQNVITILEESLQLTQPLKHHTETVIEKDWVSESQRHFPQQIYNNTLCICPTWHQRPDTSAVVMLEPGLAFGTGTHPTTQLCLTWLAKNSPREHTVIDYGCGSGILALASLALGASEVWATDHDEQALESTHNNIALNDHLDASLLNVVEPKDIPAITAPLVIANILANPLVSLQPRLTQLVSPSGHLLLSGILQTEIEKITQAYQHNFTIINISQQEEWVSLHLQRKS